jgi:glycosyltransferase involved in cell wall biosynthesis
MSREHPSISVVLPVYNGARHLAESIDSVLAQTFSDFELLIADDGSNDDSPAILSSYLDPRVRATRNPRNLGLFPNLNRLIEASRAPLIRLWSQDDVMRPECLARHLAFLSDHPSIGMSYCAVDVIDERGVLIEPARYDSTPDVLTPSIANQIMFFHGSITGNIANVMLHRDLIDELGSFREDLQVSGDFEMWVRITRRHAIGFLREPLIALRRHQHQFSRKKGIGLQFMRENRAIVDELLSRMPAETRSYASRYRQYRLQSLNAHYMIRSLLAGDFGTAAACYRELKNDGLERSLLYWLVSGNERWLRMPPRIVTGPDEQTASADPTG